MFGYKRKQIHLRNSDFFDTIDLATGVYCIGYSRVSVRERLFYLCTIPYILAFIRNLFRWLPLSLFRISRRIVLTLLTSDARLIVGVRIS
jgi:hypothetical protein